MHNYIDSNDALPLGRTLQAGTYRPFSQQARILGFMEQNNIFNSLNFSLSSYDPSNVTGAAVTINSFLCPSDAARQIPTGLILPGFASGAVNYRANEGTSVAMWYGADDTTNVNNGIVPPPNGLFYSGQLDHGSPTSPTARATPPPSASTSSATSATRSPPTLSDTFEPGTHPPTSDDAYQHVPGDQHQRT